MSKFLKIVFLVLLVIVEAQDKTSVPTIEYRDVEDPKLIKQFKSYQKNVELFNKQVVKKEQTYTEFNPVGFKPEVLDGMNYYIKYDIGNSKNIELKIYVPLRYKKLNKKQIIWLKNEEGIVTLSGTYFTNILYVFLSIFLFNFC